MPGIWEMNGFSIIAAGPLPNLGAAWQVKDDGPIPVDQMGTAAAGFSLPLGGAPLPSAPNLLAAVGTSGLGSSTSQDWGGFLPLIGQQTLRT